MGVQSIDRAVSLLTALGSYGAEGARLIDLQRAVGLSRPTVHRLLGSLMEHGLVANDEASRTYRLGWETAVLGWSAARDGHDLREVAQASVERLAQASGETAVLCACSRLDLVCIDRRSGDYPIKVFTVEIGARRPLGVGAGSLAVLATMPEETFQTTLKALERPLKAYPERLRAGIVPAVRAARKNGYSISDGFVLPNVRGVGIAIRDPRGNAIGSLGLASIAERATGERLDTIIDMLERERTIIERALREPASPRSASDVTSDAAEKKRRARNRAAATPPAMPRRAAWHQTEAARRRGST